MDSNIHLLCIFFVVAFASYCVEAQTNAALTSNGATCTASLDGLHPCSGAIDGVAETSSNFFRWDFMSDDPANEWIQIDFASAYNISSMRIIESFWNDEKNLRDLRLSFSDGSTSQQVSLIDRTSGFVWEEFDLEPVVTSSVRITILSSYGGRYNTIVEVEFYGDAVGTFSEWSEWNECSRSCGTGEQERTRECDDAGPCEGQSVEVQSCNTEPCQEPTDPTPTRPTGSPSPRPSPPGSPSPRPSPTGSEPPRPSPTGSISPRPSPPGTRSPRPSPAQSTTPSPRCVPYHLTYATRNNFDMEFTRPASLIEEDAYTMLNGSGTDLQLTMSFFQRSAELTITVARRRVDFVNVRRMCVKTAYVSRASVEFYDIGGNLLSSTVRDSDNCFLERGEEVEGVHSMKLTFRRWWFLRRMNLSDLTIMACNFRLSAE